MTEILLDKQTILEYFQRMRSTATDDIPDRIVHSTDPTRYKSQKGWWAGVFLVIEVAIEEGIITDRMKIASLEFFMNEYRAEDFFNPKNLTTKTDVEQVNKVLETLL